MVEPGRGWAIVTGASSGIGAACVHRLLEDGYHVVAADVTGMAPPTAIGTPDKLRPIRCDVRVESDVKAVIAAIPHEAPLSLLVNNAGVTCVGALETIDEETWDRCLDTNLKGAYLFCKHALPRMRPRGGAVINMASNAGLLPRADDPVYCVSKAGLIMLTKALALAHAHERIRVNAVCPGPVERTGMIDREVASSADPEGTRRAKIDASPLGAAFDRMSWPEEVAAAVAYLASDAAVMITGTVLAIDGGKSLGVPPGFGRLSATEL